MNTAKKNIVLLVLLIVQVALIAFLYRPGQKMVPAAANIFTSLMPEKVTAMTITDDQGKTMTLAKKDGVWQLSQGEFPADQAKVEELLKKFAESKASRLVSQTGASHARLKVAAADFNRKLELVSTQTDVDKGQADAKTVFYLGTAPSAKSIHLRLADANEVYQINDLSAWQVQADQESWWQTRYFSQPLDSLSGLTIVNTQGTVELVKEGDKEWRLKEKPEETLDAKRVEMLLNSVSEISIASYQPKDFRNKSKPVATITYLTKDGAPTLEIWAKAKAEDADLIVKASTSAFFAKVKEYAVKEALEIKAESLIAVPALVDDATSSPPGTGGEQADLEVPAPVTTPPGK